MRLMNKKISELNTLELTDFCYVAGIKEKTIRSIFYKPESKSLNWLKIGEAYYIILDIECITYVRNHILRYQKRHIDAI